MAYQPTLALAELTKYKQFILWKVVPKQGSDRDDKVPYNPMVDRFVDAHDTSAWLTYTDALQLSLAHQCGLGFVFTESDPLFFIDIDECAVDGGWNQTANTLVSMLPGACVEISHSGRGLHIIAKGNAPKHPEARSIKNQDMGFDLYTSRRFVALTGTGAVGDASTDHTAALETICRLWLPPKERVESEWSSEPHHDWSGPDNDVELLDRALRSKSAGSAFGTRASFRDLWEANEDVLSKCYPDDHNGRPYDPSIADMSLAQHLAFWTGNNHERIQRLMFQSSLYRDKWEDRDDYIPRTIENACAMQKTFYSCGKSKTGIPADATPVVVELNFGLSEPKIVVGSQTIFANQLPEYFAGCVYVQSLHRVLTPDGLLLPPEQFKASYGGYLFALDPENSKTTKSAWEAFTESQAVRFPKVHDLRFRPKAPPGQILSANGRWYVNSYVPLFGDRKPGDPTPFISHVKRLIPDPTDADIFLSYLAACVQHVGTKFQWCPVLQGVQGNGKTIIHKVMSHALGEPYCHIQDPNDLDNSFNAWVEGHLLCTIEELWVQGNQSILNRLKPLITNDRVAIQQKKVDQRTGDNCANFLIFSNYKDAITKTKTDRRYCVFYTAQQSVEDLANCGMTEQYFVELFDWLESGGYEIVADYLATRAVNVNVMGRAPETSSTRVAMKVSLGTAEQIILDAIDMGDIGFRGGLLCTRYVKELLQAHRKNLSPQAIVTLLTELGYVRHPVLLDSEGRVTIDGVRRRIYADPNNERVMALLTTNSLVDYWRGAQTEMRGGV